MIVGSTISHYRVLEKLGEGGMGVVYKAEDTKLERTVALKFLAAHLLDNDEAKERFLREAKAAAALSHPNICHVYEIDQADGKTFISMAFVEGETLDDRISRGPLPIKDALEIGRQIAKGLEAAHEKGIVHRDIKPANVLVAGDGQVTIMDFGLARLTEASRLTKADTTMGTVAYMSPEQAQGGEVDHRSDVWALGCVLYEMVAGVRPFQGQYDQALLYEIVQQEPEPLTGVRAGVPMELEFIVGKCLAKDAADRYQHASEIAVDLRTLAEKLKSGRSTILRTSNLPVGVPATMSSAQTLNPVAAPPPDVVVSNRRQMRAAYGLAGVLAVTSLALSFAYFSRAPTPTPLRRFSFAPDQFSTNSPVISPDGRSIVYTVGLPPQSSIWLRPLGDESARELSGSAGAWGRPFWSPDSLSIGFRAGMELKRVSIEGGDPTTLCELTGTYSNAWLGGTWSPDGERIVFSSGLKLHVIPARGGEPELLFDPAGEPRTIAVHPHFLPADGGPQRVVYSAAADPQERVLAVIDLETRERRELSPGSHPVYAPDGFLIHGPMDGGPGLWALPFSVRDLEPTGRSFPIDETGQAASISLDGTLVYGDAPPAADAQRIVIRNRSGQVVQTVGESIIGGQSPAVSPDGRAVGLEIAGDIWVYDLERGVRTRLTSSPDVRDHTVFWPSSSDELSYASRREEGDRLLTQVADGSVPPRTVLDSSSNLRGLDWSPDERHIIRFGGPVGAGPGAQGGLAYWERGPDGSWSEETPYLVSPSDERLPQLSPGGRFTAYQWNVSGRYEVYVRPFPPAPGQWQVSIAGGVDPRWSGDGRELFFIEEGVDAPTILAVPVSTQSGFVSGQPTRLFEWPNLAVNNSLPNYDVFPDGEKFVALEATQESDREAERPAIRIVQNWYEEFRDRE